MLYPIFSRMIWTRSLKEYAATDYNHSLLKSCYCTTSGIILRGCLCFYHKFPACINRYKALRTVIYGNPRRLLMSDTVL